MKTETIAFSVDTASCLIQAERELQAQGPAAMGLRFGLREIRRHLHAIATHALEVNDEWLIETMKTMCIILPESEVDERKNRSFG